MHDLNSVFFTYFLSLIDRCCSQSPGKAEASGAYHYEEPAHHGQGHPQPQQSYTRIQVGGKTNREEENMMIDFSSELNQILLWSHRLQVPDMSPKPQPSPSDQRKDLALRRTGEVALPEYSMGVLNLMLKLGRSLVMCFFTV